MADNSPTSGGSGDVVATDDLANVNGVAFTGAKVQRVKVGYGADGYLQDVTEAKGLPVTVNPVQNPAGLPVFSDAADTLIRSTSNDARSLLDVLDPLGDNYVTPPVEAVGSLGRVLLQDSASGGLVMLPTTRNYTGAGLGSVATNGGIILGPIPCGDMTTFACVVQAAATSGFSFEILMGNGTWFALPVQVIASGAAWATNPATSGTGGLTVNGALSGAQFFRVRCVAAQQCNVVLQLSQAPIPTQQLVSVVVTQATASNLLAQVFGASAEDAAASGNPVLVGGVARTAIVPTTVVAGDVVRKTMNLSGATITEAHCVDELRWSYAAAAAGIANSTTPVTIKAAPAAGTHLCLCSGFIMSEALTAATEFVIREITTTTVVFRTKLWTSGMAGTQIIFDPPIKVTSANGLEIVTLTASVAGAVYFNANGYTANG